MMQKTINTKSNYIKCPCMHKSTHKQQYNIHFYKKRFIIEMRNEFIYWIKPLITLKLSDKCSFQKQLYLAGMFNTDKQFNTAN